MRQGVRQQWRCFCDDRPGHRFENYQRRARKGGQVKLVLRVGLGAALCAVGVVMLFIPGPGLLFILFGLAMWSGDWKRLARLLDRAEPRARRAAHQARRWWDATSLVVRAALAVVALGLAGAAAYAVWLWVQA